MRFVDGRDLADDDLGFQISRLVALGSLIPSVELRKLRSAPNLFSIPVFILFNPSLLPLILNGYRQGNIENAAC